MQRKIRNCCTITKRKTARYNCSSVTSSIETTLKRSRLKITQIFVCKWQYFSGTFAKILTGIKMVEKHKIRKNQQTFNKCTMCNNKININLYCITTRRSKKPKRDKEYNWCSVWKMASYQLWQIQVQSNFRSTFVIFK